MVDETDFLELYRKLKFSPDGGVVELKRAYRRHVSLLHPDRRADGPLDVRAAQILQRLTVQYAAAMEFHRIHGRLPGTLPLSKPASVGYYIHAARTAPARQLHRYSPVETARPHSLSRSLMFLVVIALGILLWNVYTEWPTAAATTAAGKSEDAG